jgi:hypothetical protein
MDTFCLLCLAFWCLVALLNMLAENIEVKHELAAYKRAKKVANYKKRAAAKQRRFAAATALQVVAPSLTTASSTSSSSIISNDLGDAMDQDYGLADAPMAVKELIALWNRRQSCGM